MFARLSAKKQFRTDSRALWVKGEGLRPVPFHPVSSRPVPTHVLFLFMTCRLPEERKLPWPPLPGMLYFMCFLFSRVRSPLSLLPRWMPLLDLSTSVSVPVSCCH